MRMRIESLPKLTWSTRQSTTTNDRSEPTEVMDERARHFATVDLNMNVMAIRSDETRRIEKREKKLWNDSIQVDPEKMIVMRRSGLSKTEKEAACVSEREYNDGERIDDFMEESEHFWAQVRERKRENEHAEMSCIALRWLGAQQQQAVWHWRTDSSFNSTGSAANVTNMKCPVEDDSRAITTRFRMWSKKKSANSYIERVHILSGSKWIRNREGIHW